MAIHYKGNILEQLKMRGYSSTRLRKERLFGQKTIQDFRTNALIPYQTINRLCALLDCQPGDIMEYTPDAPQNLVETP